MLTSSKVESLLRAGKRAEIADGTEERGGGRLVLQIKPTKDGVSGTWYAVWFSEGHKRRYKIGKTGPGGLTLKKAREKFSQVISPFIQEGLDPKEEMERQKREDEKRRELEQRELERQAREAIPFQQFFEEHYLPEAEASKKPETVRKEKEHVQNWIAPVVGKLPFKEIGLPEVKRIRANLKRKKRSPRTQEYVLRTFTTIWNAAVDDNLPHERCPTKSSSFKLERIDNERKRYLTYEESEKLLQEIKKKNQQVHNMALVALEAGLRFGEIAALRWSCIDLENKVIHVMNTKSGKDRTVPMTKRLEEMFDNLDKTNGLVFPNSEGDLHTQVPSAFKRACKDSGLNDGITDSKHRISFHGLRHTCASRLIQADVDLYRVQKILGHGTPTVTQRYSHLANEDLRAGMESMEKHMLRYQQEKESAGKVISFDKAKESIENC